MMPSEVAILRGFAPGCFDNHSRHTPAHHVQIVRQICHVHFMIRFGNLGEMP